LKRADSHDDPIKLKFGRWSDLQGDATWVRSRVFVDEQGIDPEHEWDDADAIALHCVAYRNKHPVATGRLLPDAHIGRVAVLPEHRRQGIAQQLFGALMQVGFRRGERAFELSAQTAIKNLYTKFGFTVTSDPYLEVGIEHVEMRFASELTELQQTAVDGLELHQVDWRPTAALPKWNPASVDAGSESNTGSSRGIYLLHGLGEHCRRYDALARWLNSLGWQVRAHDHRGHGASAGKRGVIDHRRALLEDARVQITRFGEEMGTPPLLLGHSMGGSLAAELVLIEGLTVQGLILSSPAITLGLSAPQRLLLKILHRLAPNLAVGNGIDAAHLSHDGDVVAAYRNDPLVHNRVCARLIMRLIHAGELIQHKAGSLIVPTLLMVAGSDRLVDPAGSSRFQELASQRWLSTRWYETAFHELFNESEPLRLRVINDLRDWLQHHFPAPARSAQHDARRRSGDPGQRA
jgi:alpha-beta hydrolase superfamily lysophospholipase/predicted GNAT family N-acyltransferase